MIKNKVDMALATSPASNLSVHASAGTGKTWLLTSRIIRLLLHGVAPAAIVAITFTRKAASEIHARVHARLRHMAGADEANLREVLLQLGHSDDTASLQTARGLYEKLLSSEQPLRTTTFHAFCQEILRRFPLEAGITPGFDLLEYSGELQNAAWLRLEAELRRHPDDELAQALQTLFGECGGLHNTERALNDFLVHRSDWWSYTEDQQDPYTYAYEQLQRVLKVDNETQILDSLSTDQTLKQRLAEYAALLQKHPIKTHLSWIQAIATVSDKATIDQNSFKHLYAIFFKTDGAPREIKPTKVLQQKLGVNDTQQLIQLHDVLCGQIQQLHNLLLRARTLRLSQAWYHCGMRLLHHYQQLKLEQNLLDFTDLEWQCYRLLTRSHHAEWVQYKLDQRIDHLLVDEFQDTNPTQWRLLLPLLQEMAAGDSERMRSVFLVGDEKQSIYRFRRADPRLFDTARDWLLQHMQAHTYTQHISWRSSPAIIDFVNLIFANPDAGAQNGTEITLPNFTRHETMRSELHGHVELLPLIQQNESNAVAQDIAVSGLRNPLLEPRKLIEDTRYEADADRIADLILELIGQDTEHEGATHALDYGDILILMRDRTKAVFYEQALRRAGIPYSGAAQGTFLECLEVRDLIDLLQCLITPYDNHALATVLRSPLFACDDTVLMQLALHSGKQPWIEVLCNEMQENKPLARAARLIMRWQELADRIPVHDLLDRIYSEGNVIARYLSAAPDHLETRIEANLLHFLQLALDVDSGRYPSLTRFLSWFKQLLHHSPDALSEPTIEDTQRVRMLTVHAAKGLEAPVVILVDAARTQGQQDKGPRALIDWPVQQDKPEVFHFIGNKAELDDISRGLLQQHARAATTEDSNLLYVALTRAKQRLYISGCEPLSKKGRGWYGFLEARLRQAQGSGIALPEGLHIEQHENGAGKAGNTCMRLIHAGNHGTPTANEPQTIDILDNAVTDPALGQPLTVTKTQAIRYPSKEDDDTPYDDSTLATPLSADAARERGIVLHRMLERLTGAGTRQVLRAALREELDYLSSAQFDDYWQECDRLLHNPALAFIFDPAKGQQTKNEQAILYWENDKLVYGIIDRLVLSDTEAIIVDYKTHVHATMENMDQLATHYREQMQLYATGAEKLWPDKSVRKYLLFTACAGLLEI